MAYSATLANMRGLLSDEEHRRLLNLFSRAGLAMDHELFNEDMLERGTKAILKTRDGLLRAAVPNPIGSCTFLNDVSTNEMNAALRHHKQIMKQYPRQGAGVDAYVDASDTGYHVNGEPHIPVLDKPTHKMGGESGNASGGVLSMLKEVMGKGFSTGYRLAESDHPLET